MKSLKKTLISFVGVSALSLSLAMPAMATYSTPTVSDCTSGLVSIVLTTTSLISSVLVPINAPVKVYDINLFDQADVNIIDDTLNNVSVTNLVNLQNALKNAKFLNGVNVITGNDVLTQNGVDASKVVSVYKALDGVIVFVKK